MSDLAQHISFKVQGHLYHMRSLSPTDLGFVTKSEYIARNINAWIHDAVREFEKVDNTVDNREKLVEAMYDEAFEEDKRWAYGEYHMYDLAQCSDEDFNATWQKYMT